jgi:adenine-specific DNA-methyltransferase
VTDYFLGTKKQQLLKAERRAKGKKKRRAQYEHLDTSRKDNPPAGLVTPDTDRDGEKKIYAHDPYLDQQLVWAGKAEHMSFDVRP